MATVLLALATCSALPDWEVDDRPLHAALAARGVAFERPVWNDPEADWERYDAVLIRTTWDYQEKLPAFRRWVDDVSSRTRLFNPPEIVRWNVHKRYLRDLAAEGIPVAPTIWLERGTRVRVAEALASLGADEGLLKPCVGATARETLRFRGDAGGIGAAQAHVDRLLPREDLILQPFLRSVTERGEWSAVFVDGRLAHCVRKIPVPGDFRVQDDFGASDVPYEPAPPERQVAERVMGLVARRFGGVPLYGRPDWLWLDDGRCVLNELELVEPSLFFRHGVETAGMLADAWIARIVDAC